MPILQSCGYRLFTMLETVGGAFGDYPGPVRKRGVPQSSNFVTSTADSYSLRVTLHQIASDAFVVVARNNGGLILAMLGYRTPEAHR